MAQEIHEICAKKEPPLIGAAPVENPALADFQARGGTRRNPVDEFRGK